MGLFIDMVERGKDIGIEKPANEHPLATVLTTYSSYTVLLPQTGHW